MTIARLWGSSIRRPPLQGRRLRPLVIPKRWLTETKPVPWDSTPPTTDPTAPDLCVYFDNIYPIKFNQFDFRGYLFIRSHQGLEKHINHCLVPQKLPQGLVVKDVIPRVKEGGALVKLAYQNSESGDVSQVYDKLDRDIERHVANRVARNWFNIQKTRAFRVQGHPFTEDLINWYPSPRLRVEFQGPDPTIEALYRTFRPFGRIFDITIHPPAVKDSPRYAIIQYTRIRSAASARNCLHGIPLGDTDLILSYERIMRKKYIWDWLTSHPRLVLPLLAGAFIAIVYAVFDPVRVFFIECNLLQRFQWDSYPMLRWLSRQTIHRIFHAPSDGLDGRRLATWSERQQDRQRLEKWLHESEIVRQVTRDRPYRLTINANEVARARNEREMLVLLAKQVGYRPVFSFMQSVTNLMDMAIATTTGQKAGLSASAEAQLEKVLECVAVAIHNVRENVAEERAEERAEARAQPDSGLTTLWKRVFGPGHPNGPESEDSYISTDTPLIVITGYMCRDTDEHQKVLWEILAKWAALLTENQAAHVLFVSSNVAASKTLSRVLPHKSLNNLVLADPSPESALEVLKYQLDLDDVPPPTASDRDHADYQTLVRQLETAVVCLGGRLTDLELLVRKVKGGQPITEAVDDIVTKTAAEVRKFALSDQDSEDTNMADAKRKWSTIQFWTIMKSLAQKPSLNYYTLLASPLFIGDEQALLAMEYAGLISIVQNNGRPAVIRPARPVLSTAFKFIQEDGVYAAAMQIRTNKALIDQHNVAIGKYETELQRLEGIAGFKGIPSPAFLTSSGGGMGSRLSPLTSTWSGYVPRVLKPTWWVSWVIPTHHTTLDPNATVPDQLGGRIGWLMGKLEKAHQLAETLEAENIQLQKLINAY
ncbi:RNA12 protein-domain-containing protein [Dimargaris cristalligena]|uniref:Mitochondrial escape protein 2 n=1 Tax=Dimargaris cristalligena TaxID=215637 RepID=A0A4P9ZLR4_9FUNG|nr:RNA12 protein-domain-containing protein [Dimargaris cristalligena]|eukprot:RKP34254.1 RNA12 protein-domain-containing protein [Dimargaris cristalligena]